MKQAIFGAALAFLIVASPTFALAQMRDSDAPPAPIGEAFKNFPLDQTWSLKSVNNKPVPGSLEASLMIDGNLRGSGYTGCNSWSATLYPIKNQRLAIGPIALTKKKCDKSVMAIEIAFLTALLGEPTWDLVNGELVIKGPRGALRFDRSL